MKLLCFKCPGIAFLRFDSFVISICTSKTFWFWLIKFQRQFSFFFENYFWVISKYFNFLRQGCTSGGPEGGLEALHFTLHLGGGPGAQTPRRLTSYLIFNKERCLCDSKSEWSPQYEKWTVHWTPKLKCEQRNTGVITKVNCSLFHKFGVTFFRSPLKLSGIKLWLLHKGTFIISISPSQFPPDNTSVGCVISVNTQWSSPPKFSPQTSLYSFSLLLQLICHSVPRTRSQYLSLHVLLLPFGSKKSYVTHNLFSNYKDLT